jgi:hypothetical protein
MQARQYAAKLNTTTSEDVRQLEALVQTRLRGRVQSFELVMGSRGLVLRGKARSYHAKQVAQHVVMAVADVPILANDIEVV